MNVARKLEVKEKTYEKRTAKSADVIYIANRKAEEEKKYTNDYLNEKLAYFYANGGPVMDI